MRRLLEQGWHAEEDYCQPVRERFRKPFLVVAPPERAAAAGVFQQ